MYKTEKDLALGLLPVYKRPGMTSFSVIKRLKKFFPNQKIGHTGTLDMFAQGVVLTLIGKKYTKLADQIGHFDKTYVAAIKIGIETDTLDHTGNVTKILDFQPSQEDVNFVFENFPKKYLQKAPTFSAKKLNGKRFSDLARDGKEIEDRFCDVTINSLHLISYNFPKLVFVVSCKRGFYVRSLCKDICYKFGTCGHLTYLNRTCNGKYLIKDCIDSNLIEHFEFKEKIFSKVVSI